MSEVSTEEEVTQEDKDALQRRVGALLPGIDPTIAEAVMGAILGNPGASIATIVTSFLEAPEQLREECIAALFTIVLCSEKGHLFWVDTKFNSLLIGANRVPGRASMQYGDAEWPIKALLVGPPKAVTIRTPQGGRQVWFAAESLEGVYVGKTATTVIGDSIVEALGGHVVEDRQGPEVMMQSAQEKDLTEASKKRADAIAAAIEIANATNATHGLNRVAIAEAKQGSLKAGDVIHLEERADALYIVEQRVNDSWVVAASMKSGAKSQVAAGAWVQMGPGPFGLAGPLHWGFSEEPSEPKETQDVNEFDPFDGEYAPENPEDS